MIESSDEDNMDVDDNPSQMLLRSVVEDQEMSSDPEEYIPPTQQEEPDDDVTDDGVSEASLDQSDLLKERAPRKKAQALFAPTSESDSSSSSKAKLDSSDPASQEEPEDLPKDDAAPSDQLEALQLVQTSDPDEVSMTSPPAPTYGNILVAATQDSEKDAEQSPPKSTVATPPGNQGPRRKTRKTVVDNDDEMDTLSPGSGEES
jgi:hypothetical protein